MNKLLALALAGTCSAASAQTPAINPMPDGSRDMFVGLGAQSAPRYEGAQRRKVSALPVLQVQWSNGIFISGMSAGMHLSSQPSVEFGPLLAVQPGRTATGTASGLDGIGSTSLQPLEGGKGISDDQTTLAGMDEIGTRLLGGGFFNYYLSPQWRLTSSALWGAGNERKGGKIDLGVQRLASQFGAHRLSLSAGLTLVNRAYNQAWFGVTPFEAFQSGHTAYTPAGGLKDVRLGARWNWALSPSWLLTSNVQATRLMGSAKNSPLAERPTNLTVSTAIAYRF
jgi:outer membrane protein